MLKKIKFASTSGIATAVDYALFFLFSYFDFSIQIAHFLSYAIASTLNFLLQKRYIFELNRKIHHAFLISISFSVISLLLSTGLIYGLSLVPLWQDVKLIPKLITTGIIFFFNYYTKKFAFEGLKKENPSG